ncbi:hypothetical protein KKB64_02990 [Patescibacteria group bacterium]|nr:hypothetical protein [Patescibacteria group bacterium]MBU1472724.1 hypothetical protein [Patescibacteria group bacterium]MBU2459991.1 hypothetical protein [Patescibacteria group bacterium]MBU2544351.1 hypothetical protein [Patescibacteria group bacterium]
MFGFIKTLHTDKSEIKVILRLSAVFLITFVLYLTASYYIIRSLSLHDMKKYLKITATSVSEDFEYSNGVWNTNKYLSDTTTPSEIPLYIFSLDGFLIDRMNIIGGFLDTSNFTYASSFAIPKTIVSPIGEYWRVFSYRIERQRQERGVILLGYFEPAGRSEAELDAVLLANAQTLDRQLAFTNEVLDATHVVDKELDHNLSFEIIDVFNVSHKSIGGPPAYIDKSYLRDALKRKDFPVITDTWSQKRYMLHVQPIIAEEKTVGIVAVGKGLDQLSQILGNQLLLSFAAGLLSVLVFAVFTIFIYRNDIGKIIEERLAMLANPQCVVVDRIAFDPPGSKIIINGIHVIDIPVDSYQQDICKLLFKNPKKQYDTLDLSDAMGELDEQKNVKRLVYDAVEAVNARVKKLTGMKLISHTDKKYCINPTLASKLS